MRISSGLELNNTGVTLGRSYHCYAIIVSINQDHTTFPGLRLDGISQVVVPSQLLSQNRALIGEVEGARTHSLDQQGPGVRESLTPGVGRDIYQGIYHQACTEQGARTCGVKEASGVHTTGTVKEYIDANEAIRPSQGPRIGQVLGKA